jgi:hypothetical protein
MEINAKTRQRPFPVRGFGASRLNIHTALTARAGDLWTSRGRSSYGGGRTMMRSPQQPSLHMAIGGPDRGQAFDRRRTVLSRKRPVVDVLVVDVLGNGYGRKGRRCEYQTGQQCDFAHLFVSSMSLTPI